MSVFSSWSYTAKATFWVPTYDEYSQPASWTRVEFDCTFMSGGRLNVDSRGEEFYPDTVFYLEAAEADAPKVGWRVSTGSIADATPPASAGIVRRVRTFDPSTFNEGLPDHEVMTG